MYFMLGICAFVANLIKKYKKWKVVASGFYGVRVAHLFSFLYCAVCFSNTHPTKNRGRTHVLRKGKQFLLH
jgi:hypothetical protein